jgi:endonuclease/exonuclease/phosphatase family metal-dependent hydrolase
MASHPGIVLTALTWNLFHGRDHERGTPLLTWRSRPLATEFARTLDGLDWEVALLQEAPPRWLRPLGEACRASGALGLTSRNWLGPARRAIARRNPDLIASNEGGSNMVLVRAPGRIEEVRRVTLARRPERRRLLLARVTLPEGPSLAVACMHLSVSSTGRGGAELLRAADLAVGFAGDAPLLFGGDLNLRPAHDPEPFRQIEDLHGLRPPTAPKAIDHLLARGLDVVRAPAALPRATREVVSEGSRVRLSDHAPVAAAFGMR